MTHLHFSAHPQTLGQRIIKLNEIHTAHEDDISVCEENLVIGQPHERNIDALPRPYHTLARAVHV